MKAPGKVPRSGAAKVVIAFVGAAFFFAASIVVTWFARHSQISGEPMRGGDGREISFGDGYKIASFLLVLSFIYGWRAWALTRRKAA
jgi:hypothetical protein